MRAQRVELLQSRSVPFSPPGQCWRRPGRAAGLGCGLAQAQPQNQQGIHMKDPSAAPEAAPASRPRAIWSPETRYGSSRIRTWVVPGAVRGRRNAVNR